MFGPLAWAARCQELAPGSIDEAQEAPETMAMPYGGGVRLDMESPTPLGREPRNADLLRTDRHSESAPTVRREPGDLGRLSLRELHAVPGSASVMVSVQ